MSSCVLIRTEIMQSALCVSMKPMHPCRREVENVGSTGNSLAASSDFAKVGSVLNARMPLVPAVHRRDIDRPNGLESAALQLCDEVPSDESTRTCYDYQLSTPTPTFTLAVRRRAGSR
jgi:hypothetical protein